jgi:hypothetical protein
MTSTLFTQRVVCLYKIPNLPLGIKPEKPFVILVSSEETTLFVISLELPWLKTSSDDLP